MMLENFLIFTLFSPLKALVLVCQNNWKQTTALPLTICVTLVKLCSMFMPHFPCVQTINNKLMDALYKFSLTVFGKNLEHSVSNIYYYC